MPASLRGNMGSKGARSLYELARGRAAEDGESKGDGRARGHAMSCHGITRSSTSPWPFTKRSPANVRYPTRAGEPYDLGAQRCPGRHVQRTYDQEVGICELQAPWTCGPVAKPPRPRVTPNPAPPTRSSMTIGLTSWWHHHGWMAWSRERCSNGTPSQSRYRQASREYILHTARDGHRHGQADSTHVEGAKQPAQPERSGSLPSCYTGSASELCTGCP